jgi:hypothetical protein
MDNYIVQKQPVNKGADCVKMGKAIADNRTPTLPAE